MKTLIKYFTRVGYILAMIVFGLPMLLIAGVSYLVIALGELLEKATFIPTVMGMFVFGLFMKLEDWSNQ